MFYGAKGVIDDGNRIELFVISGCVAACSMCYIADENAVARTVVFCCVVACPPAMISVLHKRIEKRIKSMSG